MGISSITSRSLGEGNRLKAEKAVGTALTSSVLLGIIIMVIGLTFIRPILCIFGSSKTILPYALTFFRITLYCNVFFVFSMVANSIIQSEGHANIAMISMIIGPVINIPLDYILVTKRELPPLIEVDGFLVNTTTVASSSLPEPCASLAETYPSYQGHSDLSNNISFIILLVLVNFCSHLYLYPLSFHILGIYKFYKISL
ncbi:MATE family efflux transporter [Clostridium estertheticum]|uniref:MATE family efflux transporter n=1 Tax=Clostridium estertheticum TaxID=238834 RepID=UPI00227A88BC|nr:MATE family efflux transporter [Clostridium estertheticum]